MEFIKPLENLLIEDVLSKSNQLTCTLSRTPREQVQWFKNGKPFVAVKSNVKIEQNSNGTVHSIIFSQFTEDDIGDYSICVEKISSNANANLQGM